MLASSAGKVRLLRPEELPDAWDPATDRRLTAWEIVQHLIRRLESGGEDAAAELLAQLGGQRRDGPRARLPPLHDLRAKAGPRRRSPTTVSSRAGRRLRVAWPAPGGEALSSWRSSPWRSPTAQRGQSAMDLLSEGLAPFVDQRLSQRCGGLARGGQSRPRAAPEREGGRPFLLKAMIRVERGLLRHARPHRTQAGERAARRPQPLGAPGAHSPATDADRALDTARLLLNAVARR